MAVTSAALDRLLAVLVVALATTGLVSLRMGDPGDAWLFVLHGIIGGALAITVTWKIGRSLPKAIRAGRSWRVVLGVVVSFAAAAAFVGGFAWVASGRLLSVGLWTVLTVHAWVGLALVPLLVVHLAPRRWRLLVPRAGRTVVARTGPTLSRRRVIGAGIIGAGSIGLFGVAQLADRLAGGIRRFTGSRWLPPGSLPIPTTFYGESAPRLDLVAWRLRVHGRVERESSWSTMELAALGEVDRVAVLDCTSGWAVETAWHGVPLPALLGAAVIERGARSVIVRSATGWSATVSLANVAGALLATGVAGDRLPIANGAPCRLVVPDRRGLDWVKWVTEIEVA